MRDEEDMERRVYLLLDGRLVLVHFPFHRFVVGKLSEATAAHLERIRRAVIVPV